MKKGIYLLALALLLSQIIVGAEVDNIYDYLKKVDNQYVIVVGAQGKSSDSFAATDVVIGMKKNFATDVEATVENLISPNINKILIGHPCDNSLIKLSCEEWPYDTGQALIKVMDNDLIIAGTTVDDTRRAAKVIANADKYPQLKTSKEILVLGETLKVGDLKLMEVKKQQDFVCGDKVCEIGEKFTCAIDCQEKNCFTVCQDTNATNAFCRDLPSNPNVHPCNEGETNEGLGYCAENQVCCCEQPPQKETLSEEPQITQDQQIQERGFFQAIWEWLRELFSVLF